MNGIAMGCYVSGVTGEVTPLGPNGKATSFTLEAKVFQQSLHH
jgi:hypothetical protein